MKKIIFASLLSLISYNAYANETSNLQSKIDNVKSNCSGIKSSLDKIFGLSVATTVSSGIGTLTSGSALAIGIVKAKNDYQLSEETFNNDPELFGSEFEKLVNDMKKSMEEKSKTLGNVRTGLMATATATSAISTGTSIGATLTADKLADKMSNCNNAIRELKIAKSSAEAEESEDTALIQTASNILSSCKEYDRANIKQLKNMMTASSIISGIGTGVAGAGTVTSVMENKTKDKEKSKKLNTATNILAGISTGTSGTSSVLSAMSISRAKKDSDMAQNCENTLN